MFFFFFFNDTATTEIYTLSLHDALPISQLPRRPRRQGAGPAPQRPHRQPQLQHLRSRRPPGRDRPIHARRSEEHTSELQSQSNLVCRLLLEKKKKKKHTL